MEYQSNDLEREILGQLILAPELLESSDELEPRFFTSDDGRKAFAGIAALWEELRPPAIDLGILATKTGLSPGFILGLINGNYRPSPGNFAWRVRELNRRRMSERALKLAEAEGRHLVKTGEIDPAKLQEIRAAFAEIAGLEGKAFDPYTFMRTGSELQALDIHVDWTVEKLIPEGAITLLHGPAGLGKTWLCLALAKAVSDGAPFLGLQTKQREVVYCDYENPLAIVHDRVCTLNVCAPHFWHLSDPTPPPKLDGADWARLKDLRPRSLIFIDTARGATDGDEIKGQDVALVMNRLKELRELRHDIILQAHTSKANKKVSKGATTWEDLADHTLALYRVRPGTFEEIEGEGFDPNALLFLGTGNKSRYERSRFLVTLNPQAGTFALAEDPNIEALDALAGYIAGPGCGQKQGDIIAWARHEGVGPSHREAFTALLNRGELAGRWKSHRGLKGAKLYEPTT